MESDLILGLPLGICQRHNASKIAINGVPTCLRCMEETNKAQAVPAGINNIEDPGHDGMKGLPTIKPIKGIAPEDEDAQAPQVVQGLRRAEQKTVSPGLPGIIEQLKTLPMPASIKNFKAIQKAISLLEGIKE